MENLQSVIENAMLQANIDAWCTSHGINPEIVTYKDGILKANVLDFYYAWLQVTDLFEIGNTYTVSWSIIHKKSLILLMGDF